MARIFRKLAVMVVAAGLVACGSDKQGTDPADSGPDTGGTDNLAGEIRGDVQQGLVSPHVGVIWVKSSTDTLQQQIQTQVTSVDATQLPAEFNLSHLVAPDSSLLEEWVDSNGGTSKIGFGSVVAFDDVNQDAAFSVNEYGVDAPDLLFGIGTEQYLIYVDSITAQTAQEMFGLPSLSQGFHIVTIDPCAYWDTGLMLQVTDSAPVSIDTFPAAATPPEDFGQDAYDCPNQPECDETCAQCTQDVDQACAVACQQQNDALSACASESGCFADSNATDDEIGACFQSACGTELEAFNGCQDANCDYSACFQ